METGKKRQISCPDLLGLLEGDRWPNRFGPDPLVTKFISGDQKGKSPKRIDGKARRTASRERPKAA
jgi:hypothetical protein